MRGGFSVLALARAAEQLPICRVSICLPLPSHATPGPSYHAKFTLRLSGDGLLLTGTVEPISEGAKKKKKKSVCLLTLLQDSLLPRVK